jgi:UDP-2,3-diacylglucosamine pyrophosphatase LpxH
METACFSQTLPSTDEFTRRQNLDYHRRSHSRENLRSFSHVLCSWPEDNSRNVRHVATSLRDGSDQKNVDFVSAVRTSNLTQNTCLSATDCTLQQRDAHLPIYADSTLTVPGGTLCALFTSWKWTPTPWSHWPRMRDSLSWYRPSVTIHTPNSLIQALCWKAFF